MHEEWLVGLGLGLGLGLGRRDPRLLSFTSTHLRFTPPPGKVARYLATSGVREAAGRSS